ncbi:gamma-glutamyltransferase family protein [Thauera sinica]|uniref:Gamma-glutamyltransferase family protein n=1 Tax=Thauera sinica TaxID=2665146 RepID=A0ABW1AVR7_9RHOO|nr:gamma-glutamyltransferase family protein [Thauera sp. K11]ATE60580.1 gamma-glutamyltransferase [Thauera sp. K11]
MSGGDLRSAGRPARTSRAARLLFVALWLGAAQAPAQVPDEPERASGFVPKPAVHAPRAMAVTANPHATEAARSILEAGGSAADAAIAAALVLGVVEPQSSGLGGGGFALYFDRVAGRVEAWDGRETAPQAVDASLFLEPGGAPMAFHDAVIGGRAVGVPGVPRLLAELHARHGRLPWARLFDSAIRLAEQGFEVSPRLHALVAADPHLHRDAAARALFFDGSGRPLAVGERLVNSALARTLRVLARDGAGAFYGGEIAVAVAAAAQAGPNPGRLGVDDMRRYRVVRRQALCAPYRNWRVCGMPPPSSGGGTLLAMLGMLERFPLDRLDPDSAFPLHLFAEAGRLAYADRDAWYGDPATMAVSPAQLLDRRYLGGRAAQIGLDASLGRAAPGEPAAGLRPARAVEAERPATSHLSVVDAQGNAVALTASIEDAFGSRRMAAGFLLNNQLTDFSFLPRDARGAHPNRVAPGRRPRSSMAPTLVLAADGGLHAVLGSAGGSSIINYVAAAVVGLTDWRLPPDAVLQRPHVGSRNGPTEVENRPEGRQLAGRLRLFGHQVVLRDLTSGSSVIVRAGDGGWIGAADPRREGSAAGF